LSKVFAKLNNTPMEFADIYYYLFVIIGIHPLLFVVI